MSYRPNLPVITAPLICAAFLTISLSSCGSGNSDQTQPAPPPAPTGVSITPTSLTLLPGQTGWADATLNSNKTFTGFTWSANGVDVTGAGRRGLVVASPTPGTYTVTAQANQTQAGNLTVTVRALGTTPTIQAQSDMHQDSTAVRSARRLTTAGMYLPASEQTVVSWMGERGHPFVRVFDHTAGKWEVPVQVGTNPFPDYHNYPVLTRAANGQILVAYGAHNTPLKIARSATGDRVDGGWTDRTIPEAPAASYPFAFTSTTGRNFVFYRETMNVLDKSLAGDDRPLRYIMSEDNGTTWKNSQTLTGDLYALGSLNRTDQMDEIYLGQARLLPASNGRAERVLLSWTLAGGGTGQTARHDRYHRNVYAAYFLPSTLRFMSVGGQDLGTQLSNSEMEENAKVLDTGEGKFANDAGYAEYDVNYSTVAHERADGRPVVFYRRSFDGLTNRNFIAVWTGTSWNQQEVSFHIKDMELRGSTLTAYSDGSGITQWDMQSENVFSPGPILKFARPANSKLEGIIEGYRQPLQFLLSDYRFNGVSDEVPSLSVGVAGLP